MCDEGKSFGNIRCGSADVFQVREQTSTVTWALESPDSACGRRYRRRQQRRASLQQKLSSLTALNTILIPSRLDSSGPVRFSGWLSFAPSEPGQTRWAEVHRWRGILCEAIWPTQSPRQPRERKARRGILLILSCKSLSRLDCSVRHIHTYFGVLFSLVGTATKSFPHSGTKRPVCEPGGVG